MAVLPADWERSDPPKNVLSYVSDFRRRIFEACQLAKACLSKAQDQMKRIFAHQAKVHSFQSGDQVLVLLPIVMSPFQAKSVGPYTVVRRLLTLII